MPLGGGSLAAVARVAFESIGMGEVTRDIDSVERKFRSSSEGMSDGAIKVELAQRKLQAALKRGPAAYDAQARAELRLRSAERELRGETDKLTHSQDRQRRGMGSLRGSIVGLTGAIGTTGLLLALKSSLAASREEELVLEQTKVAVESAGLSWEKYAKRIETVTRAQSALGFDDEKLLQTFSTFVRRTKDVDEALRLNALSADLARGRYIDLEAASLLVLKASLGQAGALRRVGIDAEKGASGVELLAKLTESYGQAAEKASTTGIAAQDRLNVAIENTKEAIGRGLLPTVVEYTDKVTKWLDNAENQEKLQCEVNEAVETGEQVLRGVAGALSIAKEAGEPFVKMLGGLENAVQAALILGVVYKGAKAVAAIRALALSFGLVGPAAARGALAANAATASIGAGALTAAGRVGTLRTSLLGLARMGTIPVTIALLVDQATGGHGWNQINKAITDEATAQSGNPRRVNGQWVGADGAPVQDQRYWEKLFRGGFIDKSGSRRTRRTPIGPLDREDSGAKAKRDAAAAAASKPTSGGTELVRAAGRTLLDIQLDRVRAEETAGTSDDLRFAREERDKYQRQVDALERRKSLTDKQKEQLRALYGSLASAQSGIDAIVSEGEQKIAAQREQAREKAAEARRKALERAQAKAEAEERRMERIRESAAKIAQRRLDLLGRGGRGPANREELRAAALEYARQSKGASAGERMVDTPLGKLPYSAVDPFGTIRGEIRAMLQEFSGNLLPPGTGLNAWTDVSRGNLGQLETHAYAQTELLRSLDLGVQQLSRSMWHPGAAYAGTQLSAAGIGAGF